MRENMQRQGTVGTKNKLANLQEPKFQYQGANRSWDWKGGG